MGKPPRTMTRKAAAEELGISLPRIDRMVRKGQLDVVLIGDRPMITRQSLNRLAPPADDDSERAL